MPTNRPANVDLDTLVGLFYPQADELATFDEVSLQSMPDTYRQLLAHTSHMTVSVEEHHHSPVDVRVLAKRETPTHYSRLISLARQSDGRIVQFGIVRINFAYMSDEVQREIRAESTPLGRILINHNVHRRVRLVGLWRVIPGRALTAIFGIDQPLVTYGRTAIIECNGEHAIELLEIVTPLDVF
ncbi:MAG: hypothetical protein JSS27_06495 [Planctomycetes bacterium]|nr:hypothetical protein [Planctomycetota bacterium]